MSGEVELTVGYVEYNEDGGIGNALQDGINYNYEQIIEVLDEYIHISDTINFNILLINF